MLYNLNEITPWTQYTTTITGVVTDPTLATTKTMSSSYRVVGKSMFISFSFHAASLTGAASGSGAYKFSIPSGYWIDTSKVTIPASLTSVGGDYCGATATTLGSGGFANTGGWGPVNTVPASSTHLALFCPFNVVSTPGAASILTLVGSGAGGATYWNSLKFTAEFPIV